MKKKPKYTLTILLFLQFFPAAFCFGLDSVLTETGELYYSAYVEETQEYGYRIFHLDPVTLSLERTAFEGGLATLYDSPRKLQWHEGMLYFLDGSRNPNTSHQGMIYRYNPLRDSVERVSAYEAEDYALTEDGIWIVYGGQLCKVRSVSILSQNIYRGRDLRRIESDNKHLYILEHLPDGESTISFYNTGSRESSVLARGSISDFTIHEGRIYYCDSETLQLMEIELKDEGEVSSPSEIHGGVVSAPKFDNYGFLYYLGENGNLWAYIRDDQLLMKIADGPLLDWRPAGDYIYIAKEVESPFHFLVDMRNGSHISLESLEGGKE